MVVLDDHGKRRIAILALGTAALIWGTSFPIAKAVLQSYTVNSYLVLRFSLTAIVAVILFHSDIKIWLSTLKPKLNFATPGLLLSAAYLTQAFGLKRSDPGVAAFLSTSVVCFIPALALFFDQVRVRRQHFIAILLAITGTACLTHVETVNSLALWTLLLSAVLYSGHIFFYGRVAKSTSPKVGLCINSLIVSIAVLPSLFIGQVQAGHLLSPAGLGLLYLVIVSTVIPFFLQFWAQKYVSSTYVGFIYLLEPIAALALSLLLRLESIHTLSVLGLTLLTGAILLALGVKNENENTARERDALDESNHQKTNE